MLSPLTPEGSTYSWKNTNSQARWLSNSLLSLILVFYLFILVAAELTQMLSPHPSLFPQMLGLSLTSATRLCWNGPSGHCGWSWTALTRCGCLFIAPGGWTNATTEASPGSTRPKPPPSTVRPRWKSGDVRLTSRPPKWVQTTTTMQTSARWDRMSALQDASKDHCSSRFCPYWPTICTMSEINVGCEMCAFKVIVNLVFLPSTVRSDYRIMQNYLQTHNTIKMLTFYCFGSVWPTSYPVPRPRWVNIWLVCCEVEVQSSV